MIHLIKSKKFLSLGLVLGTAITFGLIALATGGSGCAKYHSMLHEDPAIARASDHRKVQTTVVPSAWKEIKKVVVIVLENADVESALILPNLAKFAKKGALLSNYFAITHPSQPNYIALISGSTQGVTSNENIRLPMKHLGDLLEESGKTWKSYGEDYPGDCNLNAVSGNYVRKHMPFLSFENIQKNKRRCSHVIAAHSFSDDVSHSTLADFSIYIPNQLNNGHDTNVAYADRWLGEKMLPILEGKTSNSDTLFVLTFDEGDTFGENKVYTVLFGAGVRPGAVSDSLYSHFSLLKTIEMILGVPSLGLNDAKADFIEGVWKSEDSGA